MRRVLLTGATGFVGRHCPRALSARGFEVHAVSSRRGTGDDAAADIAWHEADLLAPGKAFELIDAVRPTHLLHLAWYAEHGKFWTSPENFRWVAATLDLFRAFAEAGGRRAVAAGSCAEYGWGADDPFEEGKTPLRPATLYGACKHATRVMLEAYAAQAGFGFAWGRVFFLYGPHESPRRLVASVASSLLRGEPARCSHGRQVRDFLHVEDAAEAFVSLLGSDAAGAVNVASGRAVALREIVNALGELTGRRDLIRFGAVPAPPGEPPVVAASVARLREEVGWEPRLGLREGLEKTVEWWRRELGEQSLR